MFTWDISLFIKVNSASINFDKERFIENKEIESLNAKSTCMLFSIFTEIFRVQQL